MTTDVHSIVSELALFADLGTDTPRLASADEADIVRMIRNGSAMELVLHPDGSVEERYEGDQRRHANFRALLASPSFGDLGRWADAQTALLRDRVKAETIPIYGILFGHEEPVGLEVVNDVIVPDPNQATKPEALACGRPRWHWKDKFNPDDSLPARLNLPPRAPAPQRDTFSPSLTLSG